MVAGSRFHLHVFHPLLPSLLNVFIWRLTVYKRKRRARNSSLHTMTLKTNKPKIILIPYPAQGHVTPMLNLAASLTTHGFSPVVITPEFIHHRISPVSTTTTTDITFISIPDDDGLDEKTPRDFFSIETAMETNMPVHLKSIVRKINKDCGGVECMIVDLLASWAVDVGDQCGVKVAGFWPAMLATYRLVAAIPEMVSLGVINDAGIPQYEGPLCLSWNQTSLSTQDLPWLIGNSASRMARFKFWKRTLDRSTRLPWLLVNTFPDEHLSHGKDDDRRRIFPVGPLGQIKTPSLWEEDANCLDWLEKQSYGSVVYISFGSWVTPIGDAKVKSLAKSLEASGRPFIWVLGFRWRQGLPVGCLERLKNKGKVVSWAPQMEVLQHTAVGCYLTHCGWNSTLEAIQCKKRLLCYPVAGDQFVNCAYIVNVWKIGIKIEGFGEKELVESLKRVMNDDDMCRRLVQLNGRVVGNEANSKMMDNLTAFVGNLRQINSY